MSHVTVAQAQAQMREGCLNGAPGVAFVLLQASPHVAALGGGIVEIGCAALLVRSASRAAA